MIIRGIDTLEFGLDIADYETMIKPILSQSIKVLKEEGQIRGQAYDVDIHGVQFTVELSGMRFYAYRLTCKDFTVGFAEKVIEENSQVRVRLMASFLWSYGYKEAYEKFMEWFSCFGVIVIKTRISRADICADLDEVKFVTSDSKGFVSRAKSKQRYYTEIEYEEGRKFTGFTIGMGKPVLARIYDKGLEIKKSGKVWFEQLWQENGWDGEKPVWRVEFQLRREVLKELKIDQVEDLFEKEDSLWTYLTSNWLMLKNKTDTNVSRWKEKRKWVKVRNAQMVKEVSPLIREQVKTGNITRLLNQSSGLLLSIAAAGNYSNMDETLSVLKSWGELKLVRAGKDFIKEVEVRKNKYMEY